MTHRRAHARRTLTILSAIALAAPLAACSASDPEPAAEPTTASAEPAVEDGDATPEQFASIIAGYESDWRETMDGAGECRILWVDPSDDPADQANAFSCYLRETTMPLTATTAARDLRELTPSNDMLAIVVDTLNVLDHIAESDLSETCGSGTVPDNASDACRASLGDLFVSYRDLEGVLDSWAPYM